MDQFINFVDESWWVFLFWTILFSLCMAWTWSRIKTKDKNKRLRPQVARFRMMVFSLFLGGSLLMLSFSFFVNVMRSL